MLTFTAAICPACIPLWISLIFVCLPFLKPALERLGVDRYIGNTAVRWMPAFLIPLAIASAWWMMSKPLSTTPSQDPTSQSQGHSGSCHCQSNTLEAPEGGAAQSTDLLYALASDTQSEQSYCYRLDLNSHKQSTTEVPYALSSARALHLHLGEEMGIIYAITETENHSIDLYSLDPEKTTFDWITRLSENYPIKSVSTNRHSVLVFKDGTKGSHYLEYDLEHDQRLSYENGVHYTAAEKAPNISSLEPLLPDHWDIRSTLMTDPFNETTYVSVFDNEEESHLLIRIQGGVPTITTVMETELPIHAIGILRQ